MFPRRCCKPYLPRQWEGCNHWTAVLPKPGETIEPQLAEVIHYVAAKLMCTNLKKKWAHPQSDGTSFFGLMINQGTASPNRWTDFHA